MNITIRCSSLHRVLHCTHSLFLPKIDNQTSYSIEGSNQHILAHDYFLSEDKKIHEDINENTLEYIKYIERINHPLVDNHKLFLEKKLKTNIFEKNNDVYILQGSPDAFFIGDDSIKIIDLKNGNEHISPFCDQLKGYALLILENYFPHGFNGDIELIIIQNKEIKTITIDEDIIVEFKNRLIEKINKERPYQIGEHCRYCPSKFHCVKFRDLIDNINEPKKSLKHKVDLLKNESHIKKFLENLKVELIKERPDFFEKKYKNYKCWKDESLAPKEMVIVSPAQALKKGLDVKDNIDSVSKGYDVLKKIIDL